MTFRAAVLHAPPFATVVERIKADGSIGYEYGGLQVDLLQRMKIFAAQDGIDLTIYLRPAPAQYGPAFDLVANDCNTTTNPNPIEDCDLYDVMVANFYATPSRSFRANLSPGWLRSTISTIKYTEKKSKGTVADYTTMTQASNAGATVCLKDGTFYAGVVKAKFPEAQYHFCFSQDDCLEALKNEDCVLYASDELQLRHRAAFDSTLQVTPESFNTQYIVWAIKDNTPNVRYFEKWIYDAVTNSTMDELYFQYFQKELCPVGTAGEKCELPCDPNNGKSDDRGICVCKSTKWTGLDCSIEVQEEQNLIPQSLLSLGWVFFSINCVTIAMCATWLFWKRTTAQVRMSQPSFLCLILVGCLISTSTILAMMQQDDGDENTVPACMAIPWLYSVGFSITFGTLFAKIRRVYKIFKSAAEMRRQMVTFQETLSVIAVVLVLDVAILTVWTIIDPLRWERSVISADKFGDPLESEGHCTSDHWSWWIGTIAALHLVLLGFACYLCYASRDIPTKFSEGKYVSIAMVSNLQIFIVGVPILIMLGSDPVSSFFVRTVIIWMNDFMVVTLIFGNLIYHVHFTVIDDRRAVGDTIASAITSFSSARKERSQQRASLLSRRRSSTVFDAVNLEALQELSHENPSHEFSDGESAGVAHPSPASDTPIESVPKNNVTRIDMAGIGMPFASGASNSEFNPCSELSEDSKKEQDDTVDGLPNLKEPKESDRESPAERQYSTEETERTDGMSGSSRGGSND